MRIWAPLVGLTLVAALALGASGAVADTPSTVGIVGPSDVTDSGLFSNVIEPQFEAAFPQYELNYAGSAQNAAARSAENGTGGPSVLLLHDPKLESKFVAGGFSYENRFGSALFYSDFLLAGTTGDAAGVGAEGGSHDIARAFAAVAAAGVAGNITYYSRGGSLSAPATSVEEHAIWKLVSESGLTPAGLTLCDVSAADGGGMTPITAGAFATDAQAPDCPAADGGTVTGSDLPSWYSIPSGNQAFLLNTTNTCAGTVNGSTHCYALTDRGTYTALATGKVQPDSVSNLSILSAEQSPAAPGGASALLTRFHGYVINPAKPDEAVNLQGAQDLISFLTSPAEQTQVGLYLKSAPKSPGAPFTPDAIPSITATPSAASVAAGSPVTVSGSVTDPEPGYTGLAGQPVIVRAAGGAQVGSGLLDPSGRYNISFVPPASGSYEVAMPAISRLIEPAAVPPFGDLLTPSASTPFTLTVETSERLRIEKVRVKKGTVTVSGELGSPSPTRASLSLLVKRLGALAPQKKHGKRAGASKAKRQAFKKDATEAVAAGATKLTIRHKLPRGFRYAVELSYAAPREERGDFGGQPYRGALNGSEHL